MNEWTNEWMTEICAQRELIFADLFLRHFARIFFFWWNKYDFHISREFIFEVTHHFEWFLTVYFCKNVIFKQNKKVENVKEFDMS